MTKNQGIARLRERVIIFCVMTLLTAVLHAQNHTFVKPENNPYFLAKIKNILPFDRQLFAENKLQTNQNACSVTPETLQLFRKINKVRGKSRQCGGQYFRKSSSLLPNCGLMNASLEHAEYLQSKRELSHRGPHGETVGQRVSQHGVQWIKLAENLAKDSRTIDEVVALWLQSPRHCRNIMNQEYGAIGLARVGDTWVTIFSELSPQ